jgi:hypothetical protein
MTMGVVAIALFYVAYGLVSKRIEHTPITGPMLFVAFWPVDRDAT